MREREITRADVVEVARALAAALTTIDGQPWCSKGAKMSTEARLYGPHGEQLNLHVSGDNWRKTGELRIHPTLIDTLERHLRIHSEITSLRVVWSDNPHSVATDLLEQKVPALRNAAELAFAARENDLALAEEARSLMGPGRAHLSGQTYECHVDIGKRYTPMSTLLYPARGRDVQLEMRVPSQQISAVLAALAPVIKAYSTTEIAD